MFDACTGDDASKDLDKDKFCAKAVGGAVLDCNDAKALVNPRAAEVCDKVDNNCDGAVDPGCPTP